MFFFYVLGTVVEERKQRQGMQLLRNIDLLFLGSIFSHSSLYNNKPNLYYSHPLKFEKKIKN